MKTYISLSRINRKRFLTVADRWLFENLRKIHLATPPQKMGSAEPCAKNCEGRQFVTLRVALGVCTLEKNFQEGMDKGW
jgi:hypothetical protein